MSILARGHTTRFSHPMLFPFPKMPKRTSISTVHAIYFLFLICSHPHGIHLSSRMISFLSCSHGKGKPQGGNLGCFFTNSPCSPKPSRTEPAPCDYIVITEFMNLRPLGSPIVLIYLICHSYTQKLVIILSCLSNFLPLDKCKTNEIISFR